MYSLKLQLIIYRRTISNTVTRQHTDHLRWPVLRQVTLELVSLLTSAHVISQQTRREVTRGKVFFWDTPQSPPSPANGNCYSQATNDRNNGVNLYFCDTNLEGGERVWITIGRRVHEIVRHAWFLIFYSRSYFSDKNALLSDLKYMNNYSPMRSFARIL